MAVNFKSFSSAGSRLKKSKLLLALVLLAIHPLLHADEPKVSMKIDVVAWGDDIAGLSLNTKKAKGDITARAFQYSDPVSYSGPALMEIHQTGGITQPTVQPTAEDLEHELKPLLPEKAKPNSRTDKPKGALALELEKRRKENPSLVALAKLPSSGSSRATVLLAPADEGTYTAFVIDDDPSKLPLGQLRVHNLSAFPIAMRCNGGKNNELKPSATFTAPIQNEQLVYELAYKLGDQWKVQENNIIPIRKADQTQMIVLKSDNQFFLSTDGTSGGFLQIVTLRRRPESPVP